MFPSFKCTIVNFLSELDTCGYLNFDFMKNDIFASLINRILTGRLFFYFVGYFNRPGPEIQYFILHWPGSSSFNSTAESQIPNAQLCFLCAPYVNRPEIWQQTLEL